MNKPVIQSANDNHIPHRITEVLIPTGQNSNTIVMPLVASLSGKNNNAWLTWITHRKPSKQQLELLGVTKNQLRIVHIKEGNACAHPLRRCAPSQGNNHYSVARLALGTHRRSELPIINEKDH